LNLFFETKLNNSSFHLYSRAICWIFWHLLGILYCSVK